MFTLSYILLWAVVIVLALVCVGALRQIGLLRQQLGLGQSDATPPQSEYYMTARDMGPELGSLLPPTASSSANGFGIVHFQSDARPTMLVFLTPLCDGCQAAVEPLNEAAADPSTSPRMITIVSGDERPVSSFLNLFPMRMPAIAGFDGSLAHQHNVVGGPLALLYDENNRLIRKALLGGRAYVLPALLHGTEMDTGIDLYPPLDQELDEVVSLRS